MNEPTKRGESQLGKNTAETTELEQEVGRDPMVVVRRRNPLGMLFRCFLFVVRIPEKTLGLLYRYSPVRMLLYRMEWYRDLADQTEIETLLEDTYGGASTRLMRLRHFIRRNVLFSVLFCVGIYIAGINLVPMVLNHPTVRVALGKPIIDSDERIEQIVSTRKSSHRIIARRGGLRTELEHCAIAEKTRLQLLSLLDENALFVDSDAASSMAVVRRFVQYFDRLDLEAELAAAEQRRIDVEGEFSALLDRMSQRVSSLRGAEQRLDDQLAGIEAKKRAIDARSGVGDINQSIKLRDEIEKKATLIGQGPAREDLNTVVTRLTQLQQQLQTPEQPAPIQDLNRVEPKWINAVVNGNSVEVKQNIQEFATQTLDPLLERLSHHSRPAIATAVLDLPGAMDELSITLDRVRNGPQNIMQLLLRRQQTANAQISSFVGTGPDTWLNYEPCQRNGYAAE